MSDVSKIADPSTVGLASFGIGLFCLACVLAGFGGPGAMGVIIPLALGVSLVHFLVGSYGFRKGELFTALAFYGYGLFWISFAIMQLGATLKWFAPDNSTILIYYIAWTIFTLFMWLGTLVTNTALILTFTTLLGIFVLLDLSIMLPNPDFVKYAGFLGIYTALNALYITAGSILSAMYGYSVLPMGTAWKNTTNLNC